MATLSTTLGAKLEEMVKTLDFMGRSYPMHFQKKNDGSAESEEQSFFVRVPGFYDMPRRVQAALVELDSTANPGKLMAALEVLTQYEQQQKNAPLR